MSEVELEPVNSVSTIEKIKQRRIERMRLGQSTAELVELPSDKEIRVALVPLLESEYDQAQRSTAMLEVPDNVAGAAVMDRHEKREVLVRAIRDPDNYANRLFANAEEMMGILQPVDISHLFDQYVEMAMNISPNVAALTDEEIDFLKKVFEGLNWKDLYGKQLYALNRLILTLSPEQLMGNLPGSFSINS